MTPHARTCDHLVDVLRLDFAVRHGAHLQQQQPTPRAARQHKLSHRQLLNALSSEARGEGPTRPVGCRGEGASAH